jgi:hypothetical protein
LNEWSFHQNINIQLARSRKNDRHGRVCVLKLKNEKQKLYKGRCESYNSLGE